MKKAEAKQASGASVAGLRRLRAESYPPFEPKEIHNSSSGELEELATAFALEALILEERDCYLAHLSDCDLCCHLVGQFQTIADLLPEALERETASAGLKDRILTQARRELGTVLGWSRILVRPCCRGRWSEHGGQYQGRPPNPGGLPSPPGGAQFAAESARSP